MRSNFRFPNIPPKAPSNLRSLPHLFPQGINVDPLPLLRPLHDEMPAEEMRVLERVHRPLGFGVGGEFQKGEAAGSLGTGG